MATLVVVTVLVAAGMTQVAGAAEDERDCVSSRVPMTIPSLVPSTVEVFTELCTPRGTVPDTVQVLTHGFTYDHHYFDQPGFAGRYSYAQAANRSGYATLTLDLLGAGRSTIPVGATLGVNTHAKVVHHLIQKLRDGDFRTASGSSPAFAKVVSVGHSYGSVIAMVEANKHHDVDGLILTGANHYLNYGFVVGKEVPTLLPAPLDPKWLGSTIDATYLTTRAGTRYSTFMAPGEVDPAMIAQDERLKDTVSLTEVAELPLVLARSLDLRVPVLLAQGEHDPLVCGAGVDCSSADELVAKEKPRLGEHVPCVEGYLLPGSGHSNLLMRNAPTFISELVDWSQRHVPAHGAAGGGCGSA